MKRLVFVALPILATFLVVGLGLFLARTQGAAIKPRVAAVRHALGEAVEEFAEELEEKPA